MLIIHRAERADPLVDQLATVLADAPDDPFAVDLVAVPTRGVERWLSQRLSATLGAAPGRADGVCANLQFPFPARLIGRAVAAAQRFEVDEDPWSPERLVWPLLDVVDANLDEDWMAPLAGHLRGGATAHGAGPSRRFATARHLADLFDRYSVHRWSMIDGWLQGKDTDGTGVELAPDAAWQAELFRRVHAAVAAPSPAERLDAACEVLRGDPDITDLPGRLGVFGLTHLPASYVAVLHALAVGREVHLYLLHPSPALWDLVAGQPTERMEPARRRDDPTARLPRNPLLASWGQDAREMQLVVTAGGAWHDDHLETSVEPDDDVTLLRRLQADVRADRLPPGAPIAGEPDERHVVRAVDRSLQVHVCHGRARQVEVVRDTILHLLADDPTLQPRDIIVMCPDIEAFSPLIEATFGTGVVEAGEPTHDGDPSGEVPTLTVRLADRSLRQTNPVLGAVTELLELAAGRMTASQVLDFANREPVRRRFRFDDDELARLEDWVVGTGIRWGLDAEHRAPYKLASLTANTWRAGLDRLLLGVAMAEDGLPLVGGVLPLDDVESGEIDLAGRFSELVSRLDRAVAQLAGARPIAEWVATLADVSDSLLSTSERDRWQRAQWQQVLDDVVKESENLDVRASSLLSLSDVRTLLADRLRGRPTRANFRTGHLTMCTLVPMRSVPHRVVCVLGLDDGVFPRRTAPDGDDLLQVAPFVGDPDPRSEDRQLLLDAFLAATDHLVITYSGRDERTNLERPAAVPLGELLDVVDATATTGVNRRARDAIVVRHPLQTFDPRNFLAGALEGTGSWSFDVEARDGARRAATEREPDRPFLGRSLEAVPGDVIELADLVAFVQHPVKAFVRSRLGIVVRDDDEPTADGVPVELDFLQQWGIGQRLLEARLGGADLAACRLAETSRGELPPGALGDEVFDRVAPTADAIVGVAEQLQGTNPSRSIAVRVDLPDGRAVVGNVPGVFGDRLVSVTYSRVAPKHRLTAWVQLLALAASDPEHLYRAATIGRAPRGRKVGVVSIEPLDADEAIEQLVLLADLYARGMREPLPLYCKTSAAWAEAVAAGQSGEARARSAWETTLDSSFDNEDRDPVHLRVLDGKVPFDRLVAESPHPDEYGATWPSDEKTRLGRYAVRLWDGLLTREATVTR